MRVSNLTAAAALAIGVMQSTSFAQEKRSAQPRVGGAAAQQSAGQAGRAVWVGKHVYDSGGRQIGTIKQMTVAQDGVELAIVSVSDFLSIGEKRIAVMISDLTPMADGSGYKVPVSTEELEAAPTSERPPPQE